MKILAGLFTIFISIQVYAQDITLYQCYDSLRANFPLINQIEYLNKQLKLNNEIISNQWLPKLDLNAQATYQSDVTKVDVNMPEIQIPGTGQSLTIPNLDIPSPDKDQYRIALNITQMIYDGGLLSSQSNIKSAKTKINIQNIEVEFEKLKSVVNQTYFNVLILNKAEANIKTTLNTLEKKRDKLNSLVKNGVILSSEINKLDSEILKIKQKLIDIQHNMISAINSLSKLTGINLNSYNTFSIPTNKLSQSKQINTAQNKLFDVQRDLSDKSKGINNSKVKPKVLAFAQAGYGKPGLNMLTNEFNPFYIIGLQFSWNIWDWNNNSKSSQILGINKSIISNYEENYENNIHIKLEISKNNIEKYNEIIENDIKIINLKSQIVKTSSSQLDNGIITVSDYIEDVNSELQSKIDLETHKLLKMQSIINYNTLLGK